MPDNFDDRLRAAEAALLELKREAEQRAEADAAPAPAPPPADPGSYARRFLAQVEQFAQRAGIDTDAIKRGMPDATNQELAAAIRQAYIEYLEKNDLTHIGVGQQPAERSDIPPEGLGPALKAAAASPEPMPVEHEAPMIVGGQSRKAIERAANSPPEYPCERDRIRIEDGQRRLRESRKSFHPYKSYPFNDD